MRTQTTRTISGVINADGSVANVGGGGFTSRKTGTGSYTVTLTGEVRPIAVNVSLLSGTAVQVGALVGRSFNVSAYQFATGAFALSDNPFHFTATATA